jgi:hypothetical protein
VSTNDDTRCLDAGDNDCKDTLCVQKWWYSQIKCTCCTSPCFKGLDHTVCRMYIMLHRPCWKSNHRYVCSLN